MIRVKGTKSFIRRIHVTMSRTYFTENERYTSRTSMRWGNK